MGEAKIEIKVGAVAFSGEGEGRWLSEQVDKFFEKIPELAKVAPPQQSQAEGEFGPQAPRTSRGVSGTLASFLKDTKATENKTRKFLATASWLHDQDKKEHLTTNDVTKALKAAKQSGVGNASQCLASNIGQGYCQKAGKKEFYVTPEGRSELGL
jgi:hypothetical protein